MKDSIPGRDFKKNKEKARRWRAKGFDLICQPGKTGSSRLAVIVKKDFGLAVERNKARRRLRELFRKIKPWLRAEFDIIVIVNSELKKLSFQEMGREWIRTLKKGGLVEEGYHSFIKNLS